LVKDLRYYEWKKYITEEVLKRNTFVEAFMPGPQLQQSHPALLHYYLKIVGKTKNDLLNNVVFTGDELL
jgi:hypothetical protein